MSDAEVRGKELDHVIDMLQQSWAEATIKVLPDINEEYQPIEDEIQWCRAA